MQSITWTFLWQTIAGAKTKRENKLETHSVARMLNGSKSLSVLNAFLACLMHHNDAEGLVDICAAHSKHSLHTTEHLSAGQQKIS